MRLALITAVCAFMGGVAFAQTPDHLVRGYERSDGTYVAPHYQTNPNATRNDNYSTRGNVNPYTGQPGTKAPDYGHSAPRGQSSYGSQPPARSSFGTPNPYNPN